MFLGSKLSKNVSHANNVPMEMFLTVNTLENTSFVLNVCNFGDFGSYKP